MLDEASQSALKQKFAKVGGTILLISAATGKNLKELINRTGEMVFHGEDTEDSEETEPVEPT